MLEVLDRVDPKCFPGRRRSPRPSWSGRPPAASMITPTRPQHIYSLGTALDRFNLHRVDEMHPCVVVDRHFSPVDRACYAPRTLDRECSATRHLDDERPEWLSGYQGPYLLSICHRRSPHSRLVHPHPSIVGDLERTAALLRMARSRSDRQHSGPVTWGTCPNAATDMSVPRPSISFWSAI